MVRSNFHQLWDAAIKYTKIRRVTYFKNFTLIVNSEVDPIVRTG